MKERSPAAQLASVRPLFQKVTADLSDLAGEKVDFILTVRANGSSDQTPHSGWRQASGDNLDGSRG